MTIIEFNNLYEIKNYKGGIKMKIVCTSKENNISVHFDYCEGFIIYEVEKGKILKEDFKLRGNLYGKTIGLF